MDKFAQTHTSKLAIVGMDCVWGSCNGLDAFDRSIYDGTQHFIPLPSQRWQGVKLTQNLLKNYVENYVENYGSENNSVESNSVESNQVPLGSYIQDLEVDLSRFTPVLFQTTAVDPSHPIEPDPQSLIMLKVADNALRDANIQPKDRVAVVISIATDSPSDLVQNKQISKQIASSVANQISILWEFAGVSFTLSVGENSLSKSLEVAQTLLATKEVDAVLIGAVNLVDGAEQVLSRTPLASLNTGTPTLSYDRNANGCLVGEGAGAVVLKLYETARQNGDRIYAIIDAVSLCQQEVADESLNPQDPPRPALTALPDADLIMQACQQAFRLSNTQPGDIGYLEVFGGGQQDEIEIQGLTQAYQTADSGLSCAIGSVKATIGHTHVAAGIASLIKTALCLYHRYIPAVPQWSGPKQSEVWQGSPFYVATKSKPWFLTEGSVKRVAAISAIGSYGACAHLILSEDPTQTDRRSRYLEQMPLYLFPIAADGRSSLLEQLNTLQQTIANCTSLSVAASQTFTAFQKQSQATYALAILGHNRDELEREIQRALNGVAKAFDTGQDWQTPVGSCFTAKPVGKQGKVAYVYPGSHAAYLGMSRDIWRLFPRLHDDLLIRNMCNRVAKIEKLLFPRSLHKLSVRQLEFLEQRLISDVVAMCESGIGLTGLLTKIMQDYFQVAPQCAFGYSLGEASMMYAQGVWTEFSQGSTALNASPLFGARLSGAKNAAREYWGLPQSQSQEDEEFWSTHVLMTSVSQVRQQLKQENRVYLTHVNTLEEVVIAGETQACLRVIQALNCDAFRIPIDHIIHCEPMRSEYPELVKLHTLPIQKTPKITFYSSAAYKPMILESHAIGETIANALCQEVDFPRLVNQVYQDGVRIFIEVGAASNCSRWIGEILKGKEHGTVFLNRRGLDDHTSLIKALAKLLSHRVPLNLSLLYAQTSESPHSTSSIDQSFTSKQSGLAGSYEQDQEMPAKHSALQSTMNHTNGYANHFHDNSSPQIESIGTSGELHAKNGFESIEESGSNQVYPNQKESTVTTYGLANSFKLSVPSSLHTLKLEENTTQVTQTHSLFLQTRQESLQQLSKMIQLQIISSQQLLNQKP